MPFSISSTLCSKLFWVNWRWKYCVMSFHFMNKEPGWKAETYKNSLEIICKSSVLQNTRIHFLFWPIPLSAFQGAPLFSARGYRSRFSQNHSDIRLVYMLLTTIKVIINNPRKEMCICVYFDTLQYQTLTGVLVKQTSYLRKTKIVLKTKNNHKQVYLTRIVSTYASSYWSAIFNQTS